MSRQRILLLTDVGSSALGHESRVRLIKLLSVFGIDAPVLMSGADEFKLAKQRCQWGGAAYVRWPIYVRNEKMGNELRYHAVVFYGLGRQVRRVGDGFCSGWRLGPINLLCAAGAVKTGQPCFVFDGEALVQIRATDPTSPEWLPGVLMVYHGETSVRGRIEKRTLGFVIEGAAEEPPGYVEEDQPGGEDQS